METQRLGLADSVCVWFPHKGIRENYWHGHYLLLCSILGVNRQWKLYKWTESVCFHHSFYIRTLHLLHVSSLLYDVVEGLPALYIGPLCEGLDGSCLCLQRLVSSPLPTFPIYTPLNGTKRLSHLRKWSTVSNAHKQSIPLKFHCT